MVNVSYTVSVFFTIFAARSTLNLFFIMAKGITFYTLQLRRRRPSVVSRPSEPAPSAESTETPSSAPAKRRKRKSNE